VVDDVRLRVLDERILLEVKNTAYRFQKLFLSRREARKSLLKSMEMLIAHCLNFWANLLICYCLMTAFESSSNLLYRMFVV